MHGDFNTRLHRIEERKVKKKSPPFQYSLLPAVCLLLFIIRTDWFNSLEDFVHIFQAANHVAATPI